MSLFLRRRFFEFRQGHSIYLALILSSVNFTLIVYRMLIEEVGFLKALFPSLAVFATTMVILYPPLAILIGHWHCKRQLGIDTGIITSVHPGFHKINETLKRIEAKIDEHAR